MGPQHKLPTNCGARGPHTHCVAPTICARRWGLRAATKHGFALDISLTAIIDINKCPTRSVNSLLSTLTPPLGQFCASTSAKVVKLRFGLKITASVEFYDCVKGRVSVESLELMICLGHSLTSMTVLSDL